jgi:hypothetical protein
MTIAVFQRFDNQRLGREISNANARVLLCIPGFDDSVASAIANAVARLGSEKVIIIVDASEHSARLGYGYFESIKMLVERGIAIRKEANLRLAVAVIDSRGWCFATPPLAIDGTMDGASAPNALALSASQLEEVVVALGGKMADQAAAIATGARSVSAEVGKAVLTDVEATQIERGLEANPVQQFDLARKVNVFNAFWEFAEITVTGMQLDRRRIALPSELMIAVPDQDTRERISTSFRLIGDDSKISEGARKIKRRADAIRKEQTRSLPGFGSVVLRSQKGNLTRAFEDLNKEISAFSALVQQLVGQAILESKGRLVDALVPGIRAAPPPRFLAEIVGPPSDAQIAAWILARLDEIFPTPEEIVNHMEATLVFKAMTYETLKNPKFQRAIQEAYPHVDVSKPFEEFTTARATN